MKFNKLYHFYIIAILVIVIDQAVKMAIYSNMYISEEIRVLGDWFKLRCTLNPGMAFGLIIPGAYGKIILSLFRVFAMIGIGYYIAKLYKDKAHKGFLICVALIFGGAIGNLLDSIFYGYLDPLLLVDDAPMKLFHGQVIDMFFFDLSKGFIPSNWPLIGGLHYSFPIFNIADTAIFLSVCTILIQQKHFFKKPTVS